MRAWSKSLEAMVPAEAQRLIAENVDKALEIARRAARNARNQRDHKLARQYALVAAYIDEQRKPPLQATQDAKY
jgi:ABC-type transporter MlaC component